MSGNELRVTVMARNPYTNMCAHTHRLPPSQWRTESTPSDWIQSIMQMVHRRREGERKREGRNGKSKRKTDRDVFKKTDERFCILGFFQFNIRFIYSKSLKLTCLGSASKNIITTYPCTRFYVHRLCFSL